MKCRRLAVGISVMSFFAFLFAGAVCAAASMKRSAVASHPRAGAAPVSPPSCPWRGSPGVDRRGRPPFHTPLPATPTDSRGAHSHDEQNRDHPGRTPLAHVL